jgi:serine/threonine protein kinase
MRKSQKDSATPEEQQNKPENGSQERPRQGTKAFGGLTMNDGPIGEMETLVDYQPGNIRHGPEDNDPNGISSVQNSSDTPDEIQSEDSQELLRQDTQAFGGTTVGGLSLWDSETLMIPGSQEAPAEGQAEEEAEDPNMIKRGDMGYLQKVRKLGAGGMGEVWLATHVVKDDQGDVVLERTVAVKEINISPNVSQEQKDEVYKLFKTEVRAVSALNDDNIITIVDFGQRKDGRPFYVMEYLDGRDLEGILQNMERFTWQEMKPIIHEVCLALEAAHNYVDKDDVPKQIIHRDIKPGNIFITTNRDGQQRVKVLDFGLAVIQAPTSDDTEEKKFWGTPDYVSPEQTYCTEDHRTDIYALGAVMYQLLTGVPPFQWKAPEDKDKLTEAWTNFVLMISKDAPRPLRDHGVHVPEDVERVILKCLEKDPANRYQTIEELKEAIKRWDGEKETDNGPPPNVIVDPGLLRPAKQVILGQEENEAYSGGTVMIEDDEDSRSDTGKMRRRRALRTLIFGGLGLTAAASLGGIYFLGKKNGEQPATSSQKDARPEIVRTDLPIVEPPLDSGPLPDIEPEKRTYSLSIKMNVRRVEVLSGDKQLCAPSRAKKCTVTLTEREKPVTLVFKKRGYRTQKKQIIPGKQDSIKIVMKRLKKRIKSDPSALPFKMDK